MGIGILASRKRLDRNQISGSTGDPWEDEGFGGDDAWEAGESLETDVEDDDESEDELEADEELDGA